MGKREKSSNTERNHKKRLKKNARKQKKYEMKKAAKERRMEITRLEVQNALDTLPAAGTSRKPDDDSNTPRNYLHYQVRKNVQKVVDKYFNRLPSETEEINNEEQDGTITPQASYDFFD